MIFYAAPMEGITRYIYRNTHAGHYGGVDAYYAPFLCPKEKGSLTRREKNDINPDNNEGLKVIPQILTNDAGRFLILARRLKEAGYDHVNLNLGCPSKTVVNKGRGSGFLRDPEGLYAFFEKVFEKCPVDVSVKTRLGMHDPQEVHRLTEIFNQFPIRALIVHARVRDDFYENTPDLKTFKEVLKESIHPVCYNGDINSREDYDRLMKECPDLDRVMIGRGMIGNPEIFEEIKEGKKRDLKRLSDFLADVEESYLRVMPGQSNTLFKMKEIWFYILPTLACGSDYRKDIRKVKTISEYRMLVRDIINRERSLTG